MQTRTTVRNSCSAMRESSRTFLRVPDTMDIRFVEETDAVRQALLEIYVALALETTFNDFDNH